MGVRGSWAPKLAWGGPRPCSVVGLRAFAAQFVNSGLAGEEEGGVVVGDDEGLEELDS